MDANNSSGVGLVNIQDLIDDASCFEKVRQLRWPDGVRCPFCGGEHCIKHGFDETTIEGFWSLLRSWLRPHRGISQEHLPVYLGFFEFVHNAQIRGKGLLNALLTLLVR